MTEPGPPRLRLLNPSIRLPDIEDVVRPNVISTPDKHEVLSMSSDLTAGLEADDENDPKTDRLADTAPIKKFHKKSKISVTDFSAQVWCELQLQLKLETGRRVETQAMKEGTTRHLELELLDHETEEVEVNTREDYIGIKLLNSCLLIDHLLLTGKCRELWIFGVDEPSQILMRGVIDELEIIKDEKGEKKLLLSDTKTRRQATEPSVAQKRTSALQLQMYHLFVSRLQAGEINTERFYELYRCDRNVRLSAEIFSDYSLVNLEEVLKKFKQSFLKLPPLVSYTQIAYEHGGTEFSRVDIPVSPATTLYALNDLLAWWTGQRKTEFVPKCESWKCKMCDFLDICTETPLEPDIKQITLSDRKDAELLSNLDEFLCSRDKECSKSQTAKQSEDKITMHSNSIDKNNNNDHLNSKVISKQIPVSSIDSKNGNSVLHPPHSETFKIDSSSQPFTEGKKRKFSIQSNNKQRQNSPRRNQKTLKIQLSNDNMKGDLQQPLECEVVLSSPERSPGRKMSKKMPSPRVKYTKLRRILEDAIRKREETTSSSSSLSNGLDSQEEVTVEIDSSDSSVSIRNVQKKMSQSDKQKYNSQCLNSSSFGVSENNFGMNFQNLDLMKFPSSSSLSDFEVEVILSQEDNENNNSDSDL